MYAAQGIGIALAENNRLAEAKDVFFQVRDVGYNTPTVWINLAHLYLSLEQPRQAVSFYEGVLRRLLENRDSNILLCTAKAYYLMAKLEHNSEAMLTARQFCQKAIAIDPTDKSAMFDLALCIQQYAEIVAREPKEKRSLTALKRALLELETAKR